MNREEASMLTGIEVRPDTKFVKYSSPEISLIYKLLRLSTVIFNNSDSLITIVLFLIEITIPDNNILI